MTSTYDERMRELTTQELVEIVYVEPHNYEQMALIAAKAELSSRKVDESQLEVFKYHGIKKYINKITPEKKRPFGLSLLHIFLPFGIGFILEAAIDKYSKDDE